MVFCCCTETHSKLIPRGKRPAEQDRSARKTLRNAIVPQGVLGTPCPFNRRRLLLEPCMRNGVVPQLHSGAPLTAPPWNGSVPQHHPTNAVRNCFFELAARNFFVRIGWRLRLASRICLASSCLRTQSLRTSTVPTYHAVNSKPLTPRPGCGTAFS